MDCAVRRAGTSEPHRHRRVCRGARRAGRTAKARRCGPGDSAGRHAPPNVLRNEERRKRRLLYCAARRRAVPKPIDRRAFLTAAGGMVAGATMRGRARMQAGAYTLDADPLGKALKTPSGNTVFVYMTKRPDNPNF